RGVAPSVAPGDHPMGHDPAPRPRPVSGGNVDLEHTPGVPDVDRVHPNRLHGMVQFDAYPAGPVLVEARRRGGAPPRGPRERRRDGIVGLTQDPRSVPPERAREDRTPTRLEVLRGDVVEDTEE